MKRVTNSEREAMIRGIRPFICNASMGVIDDEGNYLVYSYNTLIFKYEGDNNGKRYYFNNNYYSKTTSRLQNDIKEAFSLDECVEKKVYDTRE